MKRLARHRRRVPGIRYRRPGPEPGSPEQLRRCRRLPRRSGAHLCPARRHVPGGRRPAHDMVQRLVQRPCARSTSSTCRARRRRSTRSSSIARPTRASKSSKRWGLSSTGCGRREGSSCRSERHEPMTFRRADARLYRCGLCQTARPGPAALIRTAVKRLATCCDPARPRSRPPDPAPVPGTRRSAPPSPVRTIVPSARGCLAPRRNPRTATGSLRPSGPAPRWHAPVREAGDGGKQALIHDRATLVPGRRGAPSRKCQHAPLPWESGVVYGRLR